VEQAVSQGHACIGSIAVVSSDLGGATEAAAHLAASRDLDLNFTGINGLRRIMPCRLLIFSNQVVSR
jgi:hypothetical protein